jgi:adenylate cyclase
MMLRHHKPHQIKPSRSAKSKLGDRRVHCSENRAAGVGQNTYPSTVASWGFVAFQGTLSGWTSRWLKRTAPSITLQRSSQVGLIADYHNDLDPNFVLGKAQASYARAVRLSYDKGEPTDREIAIRLAREVAASGSDDPEALRRVAHVLGYNAKAYEEALGAITKSLELNPNSATAYNSSGWIRLYLDQPDAAEEHFRRAIRLSPVDPERGMATTGLAVSFLMRGRHADGLHIARQAVREMPQYPSAHKVLIQALVLNDLEKEARAAAARFLELSPGYTLTYQKKITPYSNQTYCLQLLNTLRQAGLPE